MAKSYRQRGNTRRHNRVRVASRLACCLPLLAVCLLGCGSSTTTLDTRHLERAAAASILAQHRLRVSVVCPEGVPRRSGFTFFCTARLEVGSYPLFVTETNSEGRVRYENRAPLLTLNTVKIEAAIRRSIFHLRRKAPTVRCPRQVLERKDVTFLCQATVAGHTDGVQVTETDSSGHVRYVGLG